MSYIQNHTPKIGLVANSIKVFSDKGKEAVENQMKDFFESLKKDGAISADSIIYQRLMPIRILTHHIYQLAACMTSCYRTW